MYDVEFPLPQVIATTYMPCAKLATSMVIGDKQSAEAYRRCSTVAPLIAVITTSTDFAPFGAITFRIPSE